MLNPPSGSHIGRPQPPLSRGEAMSVICPPLRKGRRWRSCVSPLEGGEVAAFLFLPLARGEAISLLCSS